MNFKDWLVGSASTTSTFKDLMDCIKNGTVCGLIFVGAWALIRVGDAVGSAGWAIGKGMMIVVMVGAGAMTVLVCLQGMEIFERTPFLSTRLKTKWKFLNFLVGLAELVVVTGIVLAIPMSVVIMIMLQGFSLAK